MTKQRSDDSWSTAYLVVLFILAAVVFQWRENKQEEIIAGIKTSVDAVLQRLEKIEKETVVVEGGGGTADPRPPQRVKIKPKAKKMSLHVANGTTGETQ